MNKTVLLLVLLFSISLSYKTHKLAKLEKIINEKKKWGLPFVGDVPIPGLDDAISKIEIPCLNDNTCQLFKMSSTVREKSIAFIMSIQPSAL